MKTVRMLRPLRKFFFPIAFSVIWHIALGFLIILVYNNLYLKKAPRKTLTTIELERLNQFRTIGEKNGSKDFSEKIVQPGAKADQNLTGNPEVTMSDLSSNKSPAKAPKVTGEKGESGVFISRGTEKQVPTFKHLERENGLTGRYLKDMSINDDDSRALKIAGLNIDFTPPKGVSEDELNPSEKMFYSFQKRTFISYVNSFLKAYNEIAITRPNFKKAFMSEKHIMVGRVTFDKEGNVIAIKIIQWSLSDDMEKLFESTLENIRSLPNPPRAFIGDEKEFSMYYQLKING